MRAFDNGCFVTVQCSAGDVQKFMSRWPCSGLQGKAVTFEFDKRNGDLVDCSASESQDGSALLALSDDAKAYAWTKLDLHV